MVGHDVTEVIFSSAFAHATNNMLGDGGVGRGLVGSNGEVDLR